MKFEELRILVDLPAGPRARKVKVRVVGQDGSTIIPDEGAPGSIEGRKELLRRLVARLRELGVRGRGMTKHLEDQLEKGWAAGEDAARRAAESEPGEDANGHERLIAAITKGGPEAVYRDEGLLRELARMRLEDPAGFAAAREIVRKRGGSVKDLENALRPLVSEAAADKPEPPGAVANPDVYLTRDGCLCRVKTSPDGAPVIVQLCNFDAWVAEELVRDDGAERQTVMAVEGALANGRQLSRAEIRAEEFARMEWVTAAWGSQAILNAGMGAKDHTRCAIQRRSAAARQRTVYTHAGWRLLGGRWAYLHGGGAVGAEGPLPDVETDLSDVLPGFVLPAPPEGAELAAAVRATLRMLQGLAPDHIIFPPLSAAFRAVLGEADFALHLAGSTGLFKTELAALCQQHFGAGLDARNLPGNWSSTGNAMEAVAFAAKDSLLIIDDFAPQGAGDAQRLHREADRILRAQGNRSGRKRMWADGTLRPHKPPRGLILSTGEEIPRGQSLRARAPVIELGPGDVDLEALTACQSDAAAGLYACCLAGFIRWLAPGYGEVRQRLKAEQATLRDQAKAEGQHARTPGVVADLALGLDYLLRFAADAGALEADEATGLRERGWTAFLLMSREQATHISAADPVNLFLRLLVGALAGDRAHVADPDGQPPGEHPGAWGWRQERTGTGGFARDEWRPRGRLIGWLDGDDLYLEPEASYAEVQELARSQGEAVPVSPQTLRRRLRERGVLAAIDDRGGKTRYTVRKVLGGQRREVLYLRAGVLCAQESGPSGPTAGKPRENQPGAGDTAPNGVAHPAEKCPIWATPKNGVAHENGPLSGVEHEMGHLGHSSAQREGHAQAGALPFDGEGCESEGPYRTRA